MGSLKQYIPFFASSFVSVAAIMALLAMIQPQFFSLVPGVTDVPLQKVDSTKVARVDSSRVRHQSEIPPAHTAVESTLVKNEVPAVRDTVKEPQQQLAEAGLKLPPVREARQDTLSDADKKKTVQILESMEAEKAAKILKNMDDYAIQQVISSMKRRQSAKILAVLEPEQAARILKGGSR
jgi:flagellar motility protein MotE (MotC chaperone)